jgi:hypothetical protein
MHARARAGTADIARSLDLRGKRVLLEHGRNRRQSIANRRPLVPAGSVASLCSLRWQRRMEPLWSPVVATGGNQRQIDCVRKRLKQARTAAVGCDRLRRGVHGKEGVDGSSPSEGSAKTPHVGAFAFRSTCRVSTVRWVWSRLWSFQVQNAPGAPQTGHRWRSSYALPGCPDPRSTMFV